MSKSMPPNSFSDDIRGWDHTVSPPKAQLRASELLFEIVTTSRLAAHDEPQRALIHPSSLSCYGDTESEA